MQIKATETVGKVAAEVSGATRFFERSGIDYCCGGQRSIEDACAAAGVELEETLESLRELASGPRPPQDVDWNRASLKELAFHIVSRHHGYTREQLTLLRPLLARVADRHGERCGQLIRLRPLLDELTQDLLSHMMKEEQILFPYVEKLEAASGSDTPAPAAMFGSVQNPIRMMVAEHDTAGGIMGEMRRQTNDYQPPPDACPSFQTLYVELQALEGDLHQHIHLENNILFPRAVELEAQLTVSPAP